MQDAHHPISEAQGTQQKSDHTCDEKSHRGEGTDRLGMMVPMKDAEAALKSLGMSEKGMEKET